MFLCIKCGKNLDGSRLYRKVKNRRKGCLNKKFKCEKCFTEKCLTTRIDREHRNESISIVLEKPKIENGNNINNNRTLLVGPCFSCKTYLMLKILSRIRNRDIYKFSKSPLEQ